MRWNETQFIRRRRPSRRSSTILAALAAAGIVAFVATRADARAESTLTEAGVVAIFDLANTADIETGAVGERRGTTKEIRDYGAMLRQVHTEVRQKGRDMAKRLGVTPIMPAGNTMAAEHAATVARLEELRGAEFDRAFLQHEQAFHAAVLTAVKTTLLPAIQNRELKDFVTSLGPAFDAHRAMAEHLEKKLAK